MIKIMISQPMNGLTEKQILETRNKFLQFAKKENLEVVNTYFQDEWYSKDSMISRGVVQIPVCFLANSRNLFFVSKICFSVKPFIGWLIISLFIRFILCKYYRWHGHLFPLRRNVYVLFAFPVGTVKEQLSRLDVTLCRLFP